MPRTNGVYSLIPGYKGTTGQEILTSQHNPVFEDVAQALTDSLPRDGSGPMKANLPMGGNKVTGLQLGTDPTDAATVSQANGAVPVGAIFFFPGSTAPENWLLCYGQAISRTTYAALFSVIGTTFGNGDGTTTFNVPDMRGRVGAGKDDMGGTAAERLTGKPNGVTGITLGATGGQETHSLTSDQNGPHAHGITDPGHQHSYNEYIGEGGSENATGGTYRRGVSLTALQYTGVTINSSGSGAAHNNVQPTMIMNVIIKAQ